MELLDEYNELAGWHDAPDKIARPADRRGWLALYHFWRAAAGAGPEKSLLAELAGGDRDERRGALLPYEVWLHDIRSGHNVGSILRTADGLGFRGVHRSGYTPGPEQAAVRAAAMGTEAYVAIRSHGTADDFFAWLATEREACAASGRDAPALIALETDPPAFDIEEFPWPDAGILVIGNEELGSPPEILERCDARVAIPMRGRKASFNLANAFAIAGWEIGRSLRED